MAEARLEEEEEELRELRDAVVLRNRNPATERSERNKPEHRLSGQGALLSIRAAIKRTSRGSAQNDIPRDRRRPEITILSAEPLTPGHWFPGGSGGFPPPPPPSQQIWGGRIPAEGLPPPSYDQVIKEKTKEQVPPPSATPLRTTATTTTSTTTIATQTDFEPEEESSVPECTATTPDTRTAESADKKSHKPPRPSLPSKVKRTPSQLGTTQGVQTPPVSQESGNRTLGSNPSDPFLPGEGAPSTEPPNPAPPTERPVSAPLSESLCYPTPLPRTRPNLRPLTREVKVQTLVRLKDDGDNGQLIPAGGEAPDSKYLQELLDVFGEGDVCDTAEGSEVESDDDDDDDDDMNALHSHRNIRAKIQAFEKQTGTDGGDSEALVGEPQAKPRYQLPKPPVLAPKPALSSKPSNWTFWEDNSAVVSTPVPAPRPTQPPAPKPLLPQCTAENGGSAQAPPSSSSGVSVLARVKNLMAQEEQPLVARPTVQAKPSLPIPASSSLDDWTTPAGTAPAKPLRSVQNPPSRPGISRKPTMIRVASKSETQLEDMFQDNTSPSTPLWPAGDSFLTGQKSSLSSKSTYQTPVQEFGNSEWPDSSAISLPPRPTGGKVLPLCPPPTKAAPGRPPPPQAGSPRHPSFHGGRSAAPIRQRQGTAKRGPVLPPRPNPGHVLYNKYTLGLPHAIAEFNYRGSSPGEVSFQKNEVLLLLEQIDGDTFECQVGDSKGRVQKSYMKIITPLLDVSDYEQEALGRGQTYKGGSGLQAQALHDFTAESAEELSLRTGDVVSMVEQVDSDWYRGTCRGQSGFFPVNYVKVLTNVPMPSKGKTVRSAVSAVSGPRCVARFDFEGEQSDELSFSEGDVIRLREYVGQEWVRGELRGRTGMFPLNFVEIVEDLPSSPAQPSPQTKLKLPGMDSSSKSQGKPTQLESAGGQWAVARYDFMAETEQELSLQQGDRVQITEHVDADWCSGRLRGKDGIFPMAFVEFCAGPPVEKAGAPGMRRARALYDFTSENNDELSMTVGDIITGVESVDEEWFVGELRGRRGLVPKSYIQLLQEG
ncbi:SH3 domain-containing protein 19 [Brienomyrus brachyistius]|uniref:SH3 domain-containing protein 19 n=1 Tax=Brienomyrus brachyistius TaxID=42636 RepID=UPI0020B2E79C|nr:SH3 domain-containing protein 19 [Brienomyrus brachyistius]